MLKVVIRRCLLIIAVAVMILVPSCSTSPGNSVDNTANHSPIITYLKAGLQVIPPLGSCQIKCVVSDLDGDSLNFLWSASGGDIFGEGSTVTWTAPNTSGNYTITVKVTDGNDGQDMSSIAVKVNRSPIITSLTATACGNWTIPSGNCSIECAAEDPDGDRLSYEWSASGGEISGIGPVVKWAAPEAVGSYSITVKVIDDLGGESISSLSIGVVAPNDPPVIEELVVVSEEPRYLKEYQWGYKIFRGKTCDIKCIAFDPEGGQLSYEWSADGGELSRRGSMVTWTAPREECEVTVAVTVSDGRGDVATESVVFKVEDCSPCAFR